MARAKYPSNAEKQVNTNRIIPVIICVVLALVLVLGIVFGTIAIVREVTSVVSYNGITVDRGVVSYLAATYKSRVMASLEAAGANPVDNVAFWESDAGGGKTYGDILNEEITTYIRSVVVGAYLFDRASSLTAADRESIDNGVKEVLDYQANNSVSKFNELAERMGFDYSDFRTATELIYKAERAMTAIYGESGTTLAYRTNAALCNEYFKTYSRVRILYIRTKDKYELDENGNRIRGENGKDKTVELTEEEKEIRLKDIENIKVAIDASINNTNGQISEAYFDSFYFYDNGNNRYNDDPDNRVGGYYFSENSEYTREFAEYYPEAVERALKMEVGEFDMANAYDEDGNVEAVLVLYRCESVPGAYASMQYSDSFFSDFYADAAVYLFSKQLDELCPGVVIKDGFYDLDFRIMPRNSSLILR